MKNYSIIIAILIGLNVFLALSLMNRKHNTETLIINNYFSNKKDSIINDYEYKKDSIGVEVDNISYDSSFWMLKKWLQSRNNK